MADKSIVVEVAYALPYKQKILSLTVPQGTSMRAAVRLSGIEQHFPEVDPESCPLGIFGKAVPKPDERVLDCRSERSAQAACCQGQGCQGGRVAGRCWRRAVQGAGR